MRLAVHLNRLPTCSGGNVGHRSGDLPAAVLLAISVYSAAARDCLFHHRSVFRQPRRSGLSAVAGVSLVVTDARATATSRDLSLREWFAHHAGRGAASVMRRTVCLREDFVPSPVQRRVHREVRFHGDARLPDLLRRHGQSTFRAGLAVDASGNIYIGGSNHFQPIFRSRHTVAADVAESRLHFLPSFPAMESG